MLILFFKKYRLIILTLVGVLAGFLYYTLWSCNGSCPITNSPYKTMAVGALYGFILGR